MNEFRHRADAKPVGSLAGFIILGAAVAVLVSPVLAVIVGACFRFPVPFAGYLRGPSFTTEFLIGSVLYLFLGGFIPQAVMGSFGSVLAYKWTRLRGGSPFMLALALSSICAIPGVLLLSVLDWIIGEW